MSRFKVKRDPETISQLRDLLASPQCLGPDARGMSDEQIARAAESFMDSMAGVAAQAVAALEPLRQAFARFGLRFGLIVSELPENHPLYQMAKLEEQ